MEIFFDVEICRTVTVGADQDLVLLIPLVLQQAFYRLPEGEGLASPVGSDDEEGREGEGGGAGDGDDGLSLFRVEPRVQQSLRPLGGGAPGDLGQVCQLSDGVDNLHAGQLVNSVVHLYGNTVSGNQRWNQTISNYIN